MGTINKVLNLIFEDLNPRQKEVIVGRFGLGSQSAEPQTLAALGDKYGITRERIRQIEAGSLNLISRKIAANKDCQNLLSKGKKYLELAGGVSLGGNFLGNLSASFDGLTKNQLTLLLEASEAFYFHDEDLDFWPFYYLDKKSFESAAKFVNQLVKFLKPQKTVVLAGSFNELVAKFTASNNVSHAHAKNYLSITKKIHSNPLGDMGPSEWPEIKPLNTRDRIYLVLRKEGKPLHFETITERINEVKFDARVALAPTVHNELIKDGRFVLVGRGIYGLAEHGYKPGTVSEVIKRLLKQNGPMNAKEISLAVQGERILKPNTILVNLQNRKIFERKEDGTYKTREA